MQIRCPHCHVPFDSVEHTSWADMFCPACGSSFSLSGTDATYTYRPGVQVLGHFELLQEVGAGRYGSVWKARDTQLQRLVAVKIPRQRARGLAIGEAVAGQLYLAVMIARLVTFMC